MRGISRHATHVIRAIDRKRRNRGRSILFYYASKISKTYTTSLSRFMPITYKSRLLYTALLQNVYTGLCDPEKVLSGATSDSPRRVLLSVRSLMAVLAAGLLWYSMVWLPVLLHA